MDKLGEISILNRQNVFHERLLKLSNYVITEQTKKCWDKRNANEFISVGAAGYMNMFGETCFKLTS